MGNDPIHFGETAAEKAERHREYAEADKRRLGFIAAGEALRIGDRVAGGGWDDIGTVVGVGAGLVTVEQPGTGRVPWSVLDAGRELRVVQS